MSRRKTVPNLMRVAIDNKDAWDFAWALLELSRKEFDETGKFSTLSATDIKNLLQALLDREGPQSSGKTATIHEISAFLKK